MKDDDTRAEGQEDPDHGSDAAVQWETAERLQEAAASSRHDLAEIADWIGAHA
jgi:hypothetical protein